MGRSLQVQRTSVPERRPEAEAPEVLSALRERKALLARRPDLARFQEEIDRLLGNAGGLDGRLAVLEILIQGHLAALQDKLLQLTGAVRADGRPDRSTPP